jgi:hypothetical protein
MTAGLPVKRTGLRSQRRGSIRANKKPERSRSSSYAVIRDAAQLIVVEVFVTQCVARICDLTWLGPIRDKKSATPTKSS